MVAKRKTNKSKKKTIKKKKKMVRPAKRANKKVYNRTKATPKIKINDNLTISLLITVIGVGLLILENPNGISLNNINLESTLSIILICIGFIMAMTNVK